MPTNEKRNIIICVVAVIVSLLYWVAFYQRLYVLIDAGYLPVLTDLTMMKYILGLSYSAEEMKVLLHLKELFSK